MRKFDFWVFLATFILTFSAQAHTPACAFGPNIRRIAAHGTTMAQGRDSRPIGNACMRALEPAAPLAAAKVLLGLATAGHALPTYSGSVAAQNVGAVTTPTVNGISLVPGQGSSARICQ